MLSLSGVPIETIGDGVIEWMHEHALWTDAPEREVEDVEEAGAAEAPADGQGAGLTEGMVPFNSVYPVALNEPMVTGADFPTIRAANEDEVKAGTALPSFVTELDVMQCRLRQMPSSAYWNNASLTKLILRQNLLPSAEPLCKGSLPSLVHLDLYDNAIDSIDGIAQAAPALEYLDVSYNSIRDVSCIASLHKLREVYLIQNKLTDLPTGEHRVPAGLRILELGANRLRTVDPEAVNHLTELESLWIGRNKISALNDLLLPKCTIVSAQSNRFVVLDILSLNRQFPALQELYLSNNGINELTPDAATIAATAADVRCTITTLDIGANRLADCSGIPARQLVALEELWLNDNALDSWRMVDATLSALPDTLNTLYLERNPLASDPQYRNRALAACPSLQQLDATPVRRPSLLTQPRQA